MGTGVIATLFNLLGEIWGTDQYSPFFRSFIRWPALVYLILDIAIFRTYLSNPYFGSLMCVASRLLCVIRQPLYPVSEGAAYDHQASATVDVSWHSSHGTCHNYV